MNSSEKRKKTPKLEPLSNQELGDDLALKLEIWENEGGAIVQSKMRYESKEE